MTTRLLQDYIKVYENFLDKDFCSEVIDTLEKNKWSTHQFYKARTNSYESSDTELQVSMSCDSIAQQKLINDKIWFAIEKYVLKDFEEFAEHFPGWDGYSPIRFNKYEENTEMHLHSDLVRGLFTGERRGIPLLSVVGLLNDNYEGGEFIMWRDTKIELPTGSIMIFPSNFLYPHQVTPIMKGVRYSYVSWVW